MLRKQSNSTIAIAFPMTGSQNIIKTYRTFEEKEHCCWWFFKFVVDAFLWTIESISFVIFLQR